MSRDTDAVTRVMDEHLAHLEHAWQREAQRTTLRSRPDLEKEPTRD
ncbi:hypothetical protein [Dactylosporangium sp. NPDC049140]